MTLLTLLALLTVQQDTPPRLVSGSIVNDDYPAEAIRAGQEGEVRVELSVARDGSVSGCQIARSSGSAALDAATCRVAVERYIFSPARNPQGEPIASIYRQTVRWHLPEPYQGLVFTPFSLAVTATFGDQRIVGCSQKIGQNVSEIVDRSTCVDMFAGGNADAVFPPHLIQLTRFAAFAPAGEPLPGPMPEWGRMLTAAEGEMRIGADGQILSCTTIRSEVAPDVAGARADGSCALTGPGGGGFEPAEVPERTARTFIATYAVVAPPPN